MALLHERLAGAIALYALALGLWAGLMSVLGRPPGRSLLASVWVAVATAMLEVALGASLLVQGSRPSEPGLHLIYAVVAVVLPVLAVGYARGGAPRWRSGVIAVGALALAIVATRQTATGGG